MLYFAFAEIVQPRLPLTILREIVRDPFGKQDVTGIAAIHHALGHIDSATRDVGALVHIQDFIHGTAVDAHSHLHLGSSFQRRADLQSAMCRRFRAVAEDQRHSLTARQPDELAGCFRRAHLLRLPDDLV